MVGLLILKSRDDLGWGEYRLVRFEFFVFGLYVVVCFFYSVCLALLFFFFGEFFLW